ncbi:ANTAR domain-containing response regulator [Lichenifustis flavocetrariae]|uniref:ANTAR domain-containing protein n=1 Tax=Lichenifustis flavocetrariae TaxID=2949735 RepID=A0AA41Z1P4_9HYPH|nr:ANTAR domain-containing protein [Lichenifustis flavocetrariae]MCW6511362.1 ANTAR domain-containing protein [Lichenifustis flavocetrariae]
MSPTPHFKGFRAVILHRPGETTERLARQLGLLGLRVEERWAPLDAADLPDLVLVDADDGWSGLLPWTPDLKPVPLIALLGSEAPGRIAWALDQGADALIAKPIASSAIYPALVMAERRHAEGLANAQRMADLHERIRLRPLVLGAVQQVMVERRCSEEEAHRALRREAMRRRLTLEQMAAALLSGERMKAG